ncbi:MAG: hypothetical protein ACTHK7_16110 [Aureliella sp.]
MAIRLKEPKPLKPVRPIRWKRETTLSESEFAHRRAWTSKAGLFQIVEATYKHPYKYPRRYLALWWNGTTFQPVSNGHRKRVWARKACEAWDRKLYAMAQQRYEEQMKRYEQAAQRQVGRVKAKVEAEQAATRRAKKASVAAGRVEDGSWALQKGPVGQERHA